MNFEWSEEKNKSNILKYGIDFADAASIFLDYNRIELVYDRKNYGEIRYRTIGIVNEIIICVVYTLRKEFIYRIISARRTNKNERSTYLQNR